MTDPQAPAVLTGRLYRQGLTLCPWGCGTPVRRTVNTNAKTIYVDPAPDAERGLIAAYLDAGETWRSRQLRRGERPLTYERLFMIHLATCPRRQDRRLRRALRRPR